MQFATIFLTLGLAIGVFSTPVPKQKRDVAQYKDVLFSVTDQIAVVDGLVGEYVAGQVPGTDVKAGADVLVTVVSDGATAISGFDPLSLIDVLGLVGDIQGLIDDVRIVVDNMIAAEPNFIADGLEGEVLATLNELKVAAEALRAELVPKIPESVQGTADEYAAQIVAEVQRAIDAYSD